MKPKIIGKFEVDYYYDWHEKPSGFSGYTRKIYVTENMSISDFLKEVDKHKKDNFTRYRITEQKL